MNLGTRVTVATDSSLAGVVVSGPHDIRGQNQYIVQLNVGCGFFNPDRTCFIRMLVVHEDHLRAEITHVEGDPVVDSAGNVWHAA